MATVQTVKGPIDTGSLGRVLMHEHVFVLSPEIEQNYPSWDEEAEVSNAINRLNELKANGIDTIVDLTVTGLGRYIPRIQRINAETDINIVAATGLYTYNDVPHYFHFRGPGTLFDGPEPMVEMFAENTKAPEGVIFRGLGLVAGAGYAECHTAPRTYWIDLVRQ